MLKKPARRQRSFVQAKGASHLDVDLEDDLEVDLDTESHMRGGASNAASAASAALATLATMQQPLLDTATNTAAAAADTAAAAADTATAGAAAAAALPDAVRPWWRSAASGAGGLVLGPLEVLLGASCPPCEHDTPNAHRYPLTLCATSLRL